MCRVCFTICLFVASAASTATPSDKPVVGAEPNRFFYTKETIVPEIFDYTHRRSPHEEPCHTCIGYNCVTLGDSRCEYFAETSRALADDDDSRVMETDPEMRREVDLLMYTVMEKAVADPAFKQCIPLISSYNSCNKENTCTGCEFCVCDKDGTWSCSVVQKCRSEPQLNVDHKVLQVVLEMLAELGGGDPQTSKTDRVKRNAPPPSVTEWLETAEDNTKDNEITDNEIPQTNAPTTVTHAQKNLAINNDTETDTEFSFDDILKNIAVDVYQDQKKPDIAMYPSQGNDYNIDKMIELLHVLEDIDSVSNHSDFDYEIETSTTKVKNMTTDAISTATKQPNLPKGIEKDLFWKIPIKDYVDMDNTKVSEEANGIYDGNAVTVMKREVPNNISNSNQENGEKNNTHSLQDLNDNVLIPLTNIIQEKQSEIDELVDIKVKLIKFLNMFSNETVMESNRTNVSENNTHFSIYKLEITPPATEIQTIRRRTDDILTRYYKKLKRDMYEIVRDVISIKKLTKNKELPSELKFVIAAMKHYIHKQMRKDNRTTGFKNMKEFFKQTRRNLSHSKGCYILKLLLNIFQVVDKGMPKSHALDPLSHSSREISKRVIRQVYESTDDYKVRDLDVLNPHFNLTNDLNDIGSSWHQLTIDLAGSSVSDRLYKMKLLHLALSNDILKMAEAKALLSFAHTRRMVPVEDDQGDEILKRINSDLESVSHKLQKMFDYFIKNHEKTNLLIKPNNARKTPKKETFLEYVRHLLKHSKMGLLKLMHRNVPKEKKPKKELSLNELEEEERKMSEYEKLNKWETDLQVVPVRSKRAVSLSTRVHVMKSRLRHMGLLPKYLRGKVAPVIVHGKQKKHQSKMQNNKPITAININHIHEHITQKSKFKAHNI